MVSVGFILHRAADVAVQLGRCVPEGQDRICGLYLFLVDDGHNGRIEI
jgi:hypothetical protein